MITTHLIPVIFIAAATFSSGAYSQDTLLVNINVLGLNVNQRTAANQLGEACASLGNDTSNQALLLQSVCDLIDSFDLNNPEDVRRLQEIGSAVAPEEAFSLNDLLVTVSDYQTTNVRARLNVLRQRGKVEPTNLQVGATADTAAGSDGVLAINSQHSEISDQVGGGASSDLSSRLGIFVNGHASSGEIDGSVLQQDSDISSSSISLGGDFRFNENVVGGISLGLLRDEISFSRVSGGAESEGVNLTAFTSWYGSNGDYLDFIVDYGSTDFETERSVTINPQTSLSALASPSSSAITITFSGGKTFNPRGIDFGGYFRFSHTRATIDAYAEQAQGNQTNFGAIFSIGKQTVVSTKLVFGLEMSKVINTSRAVLIPLARLEYVTENETNKDDIEATLIYTGTVARYQGTDRVGSYSNIGIGASAVFSRGRSAFAFYETHLQHDLVSQDWLKFGLRLEFQ